MLNEKETLVSTTKMDSINDLLSSPDFSILLRKSFQKEDQEKKIEYYNRFPILKEKGITGKYFAKEVGITEVGMSNIVKGQNFPRQELLLKIADTLNVDVRELFYSTKEGSSTDEKLDEALRILKEYKEEKGS